MTILEYGHPAREIFQGNNRLNISPTENAAKVTLSTGTLTNKNAQVVDATTQAALWIAASGLKIALTDLIISASAASAVTAIVGTSTLGPFYMAANASLDIPLNAPIKSAASGTLFWAATAGTVSISASGYEE